MRFLYYKYWNRVYFWLIGIDYGRNMMVSEKVYVTGSGKITIGDNFRFSSGDSINPICRNIRGTIHVANNKSKIVIGNNVGISSACLWSKESIIIGNNVNIGGDCIIMDNDAHPHDFQKRRSSYVKEMGYDEYQQTIPAAPVQIDDDAWIGSRCQILKGVHIGARSIIAAGSIVVKDVPADSIAGGVPAKIIAKL